MEEMWWHWYYQGILKLHCVRSLCCYVAGQSSYFVLARDMEETWWHLYYHLGNIEVALCQNSVLLFGRSVLLLCLCSGGGHGGDRAPGPAGWCPLPAAAAAQSSLCGDQVHFWPASSGPSTPHPWYLTDFSDRSYKPKLLCESMLQKGENNCLLSVCVCVCMFVCVHLCACLCACLSHFILDRCLIIVLFLTPLRNHVSLLNDQW